jgi:hypothetical protein
MNPAPDGATDRLAAAVAIEARKNNLTNFDVAVGNTVINNEGKTDRNLFLTSNELPAGKNVYTSEANALNTPVADQAVKAQQAQTAPAPQVANPQLETQTQEPKARSMQ